MARTVHIGRPLQQGSIARLSRATHSFGKVTALGALLFVLALVGSLAVRVLERAEQLFAKWQQRRRARAEDRQLWELALGDPRVMADLVALQQQTPRAHSDYF